jgi:hypothetical protein
MRSCSARRLSFVRTFILCINTRTSVECGEAMADRSVFVQESGHTVSGFACADDSAVGVHLLPPCLKSDCECCENESEQACPKEAFAILRLCADVVHWVPQFGAYEVVMP